LGAAKENSNVSHRIYRAVFVLFVLAFSLRMFAQSEVGISINSSEFEESTVVDDDGESVTFDFDEGIGLGLTFNKYWTRSFSTEFAVQTFSGEMSIGETGSPAFVVGELNGAAISGMGQFHFNRAGRFSPYVGGGIAFVGGEFEFADDLGLDPDDETTFDLETEATWLAGVGVDVKLTERVLLNGDLRYMPWSAQPEDSEALEDRLDVDPMVISVGVKFRW
jgi:outer membrane protein W